MLNNLDLNFTAFTLSGIIAFLLGLVWYHPKILGNRWMEARGLNPANVNRSPLPFVASLFLWMLSACFYAFIAEFMQVNTPDGYFCLSCLLWVAFSLPPTFMSALYTGYSFEAMAIDASYQLAGYYSFAAVHIVLLEAHLI